MLSTCTMLGSRVKRSWACFCQETCQGSYRALSCSCSQCIWDSVSLHQEERIGITIVAGKINPHPQKKIGLLLYNRSNKECMWNSDDPSGYHLILPCQIVAVSGHMQPLQPEKSMVLRYLSKMRGGSYHSVTPTPRPTEMIANGNRNLDE